MISYILMLHAIVLLILAYYLYYKDILRSKIHPSKISWTLWCLSSVLETITYKFVSADWLKQFSFFVPTVACIVLTISIWKFSKWQQPDNTDKFIIVISVISSVVWYWMNSAWMAHLILMISVPLGFIPTLRNAIRDYRNEDNPAWGLWCLSDSLVFIVILMRLEAIEELPYLTVELICHFSVFGIVLFKKLRTKAPYISNSFDSKKGNE